MLRSVTSVPRLPSRAKDSHKGTFGKVLIVAGSVGMSGAAVLAGLGALRGGAGLVQIACSTTIQPVVAAANPCYLTVGLMHDSTGQLTSASLETLDAVLPTVQAVAFGPGIGRGPDVIQALHHILTQYEGPIIIDADGLHALTQLQQQGQVLDRRIPLTCTPHPGEFAQMTGLTTQLVQADRKQQALRYVMEHKVLLVLKGHGTLVTDGQRVYVNTTGNAGMAKGGSGDVLTGLIASLAAQGMAPLEAAQAAVYLHGSAGDLAAATLTEQSMLPTDLVEALPMAFRKYNPVN
ncbi:MAG TPA: NAD(P)H-hydrate dehydratase [Gemmatales bacterium]|nr:NAD(P)H-hydrate dehydratase [Gemmatales bacterium]